jgi:predicted permease
MAWRDATDLSTEDLEELEQHILDSVRAQVAAGVPESTALETAIAKLGEPWAVGREFRKVDRPARATVGLSLDLRLALRQAWAHKGFTGAATLSIGVAIALNAIAFSVIDSVLLADSGYADSRSVVEIYTASVDDVGRPPVASWPIADDLRREGSIFDGVVGYEPLFGRLRVGDGQYEAIFGEAVDGSYFDVLGVTLERGHAFSGDDARLGAAVAVVGWERWRRGLREGEDLLGSTIDLNGEAFTVVGVAPRGFKGAISGFSSEIFVPRWRLPVGRTLAAGATPPDQDRGRWQAQLKGRLRPGVDAASAEAYLTSRLPEWTAQEPESYTDVEFSVVRSDRVAVSPAADRFLYSAAGAVMLVLVAVLLVACMNVAGFLLSRGADRWRELQMRRALGATRARLLRQLFTESLLIAALGAGCGLGLCAAAILALRRVDLPIPLPIDLELSLSASVVAFTVVIAGAAAVAFGLVPAVHTMKNLGSVARGGTGDRGGSRARSAVISAQVAFSVALLVGGGLLTRSLWVEAAVDPGIRTAGAGIVTLELGSSGRTLESLPDLLAGVRLAAATQPVLDDVVFTSRVPLGTVSTTVRVGDGRGDESMVAEFAVSEDYFSAVGIAITEGTAFPADMTPEGEPVAVVSRSLADRLAESDIGLGSSILVDSVPTRIVGIAEDVKVSRPRERPTPHIYRPLSQAGAFLLSVVGTSGGRSVDALAALQAAVADASPDVVVWNRQTIEDHLDLKLLAPRVAAGLLVTAASMALLLTLVGIFGSVQYSSGRRTREMAIRLSLGAPARLVVRAIILPMVWTVGSGVAMGLGLSALIARSLRGALVGTSPADAVSYSVALSLIIGTTLVASYLPARRATRVELRRLLDDS